MPNSFSHTHIERLKREAKLLGRAQSIGHSQALDRVAEANGYALMKHCSPSAISLPASTGMPPALRPPLVFTRAAEAMREALRKVPERRYARRIDDARRLTQDICHEFASAANALDYAIDYMTVLLTVPRYKIQAASTVNWEMRCWLPYEVGQVGGGTRILLNRRYKPVGQVSDDWVKYEQFTHLHLQLGNEGLVAFAHRGSDPGYLFNDGCPPWWSRRDAESYLKRLRILRAALP